MLDDFKAFSLIFVLVQKHFWTINVYAFISVSAIDCISHQCILGVFPLATKLSVLPPWKPIFNDKVSKNILFESKILSRMHYSIYTRFKIFYSKFSCKHQVDILSLCHQVLKIILFIKSTSYVHTNEVSQLI